MALALLVSLMSPAAKPTHSLLIVTILSLLWANPVIAVAQSISPPGPPSESHVLYAPVAGIADFESWEIVITSREAVTRPATLTLYSESGEPFPS
jgi:hypothetical protein